MAEFLNEQEADSRYGSKGKANAGLTLGIIGTALGGLAVAGRHVIGNGSITTSTSSYIINMLLYIYYNKFHM